jgi:hypothetical protein
MRTILYAVFLSALCSGVAFSQTTGLGHSTLTCIDKDGDGYGVGPGCIGPDADDFDATVWTGAQAIAKYGSLSAFLQHSTGRTYSYSASRIWYIAGNGNDSTCAVNNASLPCATFAHVRLSVSPNDVVMWRGGVYTEYISAVGGTSGNPIVYMAYPGESVLLNQAATGYLSINGIDISNYTVDGFTVTGGEGTACLEGGSSSVAVGAASTSQNVTFRNVEGAGPCGLATILGANGLVNWLIEDIVAHDNYSASCSTSCQHGIYLGARQIASTNVIVRRVIAYDNNWNGIHMNGQCFGCYVEQSVAYNNGISGFDFQNGYKNSFVLSNLAFNNATQQLTFFNYTGNTGCNTNPSQAGCPYDQTGNLIENNVFFGTGNDFFSAGATGAGCPTGISDCAKPAVVFNNATGTSPPTGNMGSNTFRNNIIVSYGNSNTAAPVYFGDPAGTCDSTCMGWLASDTFDHNLFFQSDGAGGTNIISAGTQYTCASAASVTTITNCSVANPQFVAANISNWASASSAFNFRLQPSSPAVGTGSTTAIPSYDLQGNAFRSTPSVGAYETEPLAVNVGALPPTHYASTYSTSVAQWVSGGTPPYTFGCAGGLNAASFTTSSPISVGSDGATVTFNGSSITASLPATGLWANWCVNIQNTNASTLTVSPNGLMLNGSTGNISVASNATITIWSDGTNYFTSTYVASAIPNGTPPWGLIISPKGVLRTTSYFGAVAKPYGFSLGVIDSANNTASSTLANIKVVAPPAIPQVSPLPTLVVGAYYSPQLTFSGGIPPVTWSQPGGTLPPGMNLDAPEGVFYGTPTTPGTYTFTAQVTDAAGFIATKALTVTVAASGTLAVTPASLPSGKLNTPYRSFIVTWPSGGTPPYSYSISAGALPAGLTLSASGLIGGIVASTVTPGTFSFTVQVADSASHTATGAGSLVIGTPGSSYAQGWTDLTGTALTSVCPPNGYGNDYQGVSYNFSAQCPGVMNAWSGGIADTLRNHLIMFGGGHGDYGGNELYQLDVVAGSLTRLTNPSLPVYDLNSGPCPALMPDGKPNSRHSSNSLVYMPNIDKMFMNGGSVACANGSSHEDFWLLDLSNISNTGSGGWQNVDPTSSANGGVQFYVPSGTGSVNYWTVSDYDPNSQTVIDDNNYSLLQYTPGTNTVVNLSSGSAALYAAMSGVVDPKRKLLIAFGSNGNAGTFALSISLVSPYTYTTWQDSIHNVNLLSGCGALSSSPAASTPGSINYPGMAYDPVLDRTVIWPDQGNTVYLFNPDTLTCTTQTFANGPPPIDGGLTGSGGTFGRFRYFPALDAFVVAPSPEHDAYVLSLNGSGSSNPSPACPSATTGTVGTAYSSSFTATGGASPYTYSISSGSLPAGLSLTASSGLVSGTPTASGVSNFSGTVTDSAKNAGTVSCSITVSAAGGPPTAVASGVSGVVRSGGNTVIR